MNFRVPQSKVRRQVIGTADIDQISATSPDRTALQIIVPKWPYMHNEGVRLFPPEQRFPAGPGTEELGQFERYPGSQYSMIGHLGSWC